MQAFDGQRRLPSSSNTIPRCSSSIGCCLAWMDLAVCRRVRQNHLMPILMLTARSEEIDRVLGLEVGADDYVVKPFSMRELLARVRALLRRVTLDTQTPASGGQVRHRAYAVRQRHSPATDEAPTLSYVARFASIPPAYGDARWRRVDLTPKEFELLQLFAEHPGRAFNREFLVERIWGYEYDGFERTVDTHITRLRKKLGPFGDKIVTVWGVGYRLVIALSSASTSSSVIQSVTNMPLDRHRFDTNRTYPAAYCVQRIRNIPLNTS